MSHAKDFSVAVGVEAVVEVGGAEFDVEVPFKAPSGPQPQSYVSSRVRQSNSGLPSRAFTRLWTWHSHRLADLREEV